MKAAILAFLFSAVIWHPSASQEDDSLKAAVRYGDHGFELRTANDNYLMQLEWRLQTRIAAPYESDPISLEDLSDDRVYIGINRARMKVGGHAFNPKLNYYMEYELFAGKLLDFRLMYEISPALNFKIGQWKSQYSRERIISSGKQQMVDRSILNYVFTLDRQQGASFYGRLKSSRVADFNYWLSAFMGTGRGGNENDDDHLMYMSRIQWNPFGEPVPFVGSDLDIRDEFIFSVAVAGAINRSPYTRFSTEGGGQLPGFGEGVDGQYQVYQWLAETTAMVKGFSWHQEFHWKQIDDRINGGTTFLIGNFVQMGYFFHQVLPWFPKPMEVVLRQAMYDPDTQIDRNFRSEITVGLNWYFKGHRNKLNLEYQYLHFQDDPMVIQDGSRVRLQWDISL